MRHLNDYHRNCEMAQWGALKHSVLCAVQQTTNAAQLHWLIDPLIETRWYTG